MSSHDWTLFKRQGSREIWQKSSGDAEGKTEIKYRGEELTEIEDEQRKVEETISFDSQTAALAWLNAGTG